MHASALKAVVLGVLQELETTDVRIWSSNNDGFDSDVDDGSEAHHARLESRVQDALTLVLSQEGRYCFDGDQFGVSRVISWNVDRVAPQGNDLTIMNDRSPDRQVTGFQRDARFGER